MLAKILLLLMQGCNYPLSVRFADPKKPKTSESRFCFPTSLFFIQLYVYGSHCYFNAVLTNLYMVQPFLYLSRFQSLWVGWGGGYQETLFTWLSVDESLIP